MTKVLVGLLIAANLLFFAWTRGAFDSLIASPAWRSGSNREPERLKHQVNADRIRVLPPGAASRAPPPPAPTACLEAGPFVVGPELDAAQTVVQTVVAAGALEVIRTDQPASWGVYMGRYAAQGALQRKEDELKRPRGRVRGARDAGDIGAGVGAVEVPRARSGDPGVVFAGCAGRAHRAGRSAGRGDERRPVAGGPSRRDRRRASQGPDRCRRNGGQTVRRVRGAPLSPPRPKR